MKRGLPDLALTVSLLCATTLPAQAQDSRKVQEPLAPPTCSTLLATAAVSTPASTSAATSVSDDTARIQQAIDHCATGQAVRLSAAAGQSDFVAGPLTLRSGVSLLIDHGVTLYASRNPKLYDRGAGTCGKITDASKGCKPFISAQNTEGSGIYGEGIIDGQGGRVVQGLSESWWQLARRAQKEDGHQNVPRLIEVTGSRNFTLHRIALRNSPNFHVTLNGVDGFTAWGVRIDTPATARNTDGIDPISSRNITIAHSYIRTGDDNIAIKANSSGPSENISVLHNHFYSGHGMSIGSETNGGVRRVLVEDLTLDGTTSGLRIKSDISRGGVVEQVRYRDVCQRNVKTPIDISTRYNPRASGKLIPLYRDITLESVHSLTPGRVVIAGYDAAHPLQVKLDQVALAQGSASAIEFANVSGTVDSAEKSGSSNCGQRLLPYPEMVASASRPQLSLEQAKLYSYGEVLKFVGTAGKERVDPWDPLNDPLARGASFTPDYIVDPNGAADGVKQFRTVQQAVNRAISDSKRDPTRRLYLLIKPGVYHELVYVPAATAPLTMYGVGKDASATRITAKLDASNSGAEYSARHGAQFGDAAPEVQAMYATVKDRSQIGTMATATVWVQNNGFQARNLTFENGYNKDIGNARAEELPNINNVHHQALALQVDGADKAQFENIRLLGFQDTLYLKSPQIGSTSRSFFNKSYIEGDVDFIFGDSTAYFYQSEIRTLGDRGTSYVAAPDTHLNTRYGFVFDQCNFTHDNSANARAGKFSLLRQWFHSARCSPYAPVAVDGYACSYGASNSYQAPKGTVARSSLEAVGKMVVLNSRIGTHINRLTPWSDWNKKGSLSYRPAQYNSDDHWNYLQQAGIDPVRDLGYTARPAPALIFLGEFNNSDE
ncbi:pectinesterase family protein [Pseudoduganella danionis]|uniref:pectinesterase family protein n=1 Tax=Pseudoduganella danionis TaxID=1890295 RepID=UPI0035B48C88